MRGSHLVTLATAVLVGGVGLACRSTPARRPAASCGAEGLLIVRNHSGRVVEVYESGRGTTEFIGFASPGVTRIPVRGPTELGVVYHVREPADGRDAATVTWLRQTAVARAPSRLAMELVCR